MKQKGALRRLRKYDEHVGKSFFYYISYLFIFIQVRELRFTFGSILSAVNLKPKKEHIESDLLFDILASKSFLS